MRDGLQSPTGFALYLLRVVETSFILVANSQGKQLFKLIFNFLI